jgi:hypothetical protein
VVDAIQRAISENKVLPARFNTQFNNHENIATAFRPVKVSVGFLVLVRIRQHPRSMTNVRHPHASSTHQIHNAVEGGTSIDETQSIRPAGARINERWLHQHKQSRHA